MSIRNTPRCPNDRVFMNLSLRFAVAVFAASAAEGVSVVIGETPPTEPLLQSLRIRGDTAFACDFSVRRGPECPGFVRCTTGNDPIVTTYYPFGIGAVNSDQYPLRWDVNGEYLFTTNVVIVGSHGCSDFLFRYPLDALIVGPDWKWPLDRSHPKAQPDPDRGALLPPNYADLGPVCQVLQGFEWAEERANLDFPWRAKHSAHRPSIWFDIRAIDDRQVNLLMSADGHLSLWRYDGRRWKREREYAWVVEGQFLWMQDPQYVVAERKGDWCVIGPLDADEPEVRAIIAKDPANPLFLIEDVHAGKDYFRQGRQILDDKGRLIGVINVFAKPDDQLREVVQRVVSRRK